MPNQDSGPYESSGRPQQPNQPAPGQDYPPPGQPTQPGAPQPPPLPTSGPQPSADPAAGSQPWQAAPSAATPQFGGQPPYQGGGMPPGGPPPGSSSGKGGMGKWIAIAAVAVAAILALVFILTRPGEQTTDDPTTSAPEQTTSTAEQTTTQPTAASTGPSAPSTGGTDFDKLAVGECLQFIEIPDATPGEDSIEVAHQVVDCNLAGQFKLEVTSIVDGTAECPNGDYVRYFQENYFGSGDATTVCLAPVLDVDVCYIYDDIEEWIPVDCSDPEAYFKIEKEIADSTDATSCTYPDDAFVLPEPAPGRVYCITNPA